MSLRDYLFHEEPGITLYCGDCREVLPRLGRTQAALVTDPPYPNAAGHFVDQVEAGGAVAAMPWPEAMIFWDRLEVPPCALPLVAVHVWHRTNVNGCPYEAVYQFGLGGRRRCDVLVHPAIFNGAGPGCHDYLGHPTQKPVPVMRALIEKLDDARVIVDPFAGVGATLVAAKELGRPAIGIEIEPRYCEIAVKRLRQEVLALA